MGCGPSIPEKYSIRGKGRKRRSIIQEVAVFVPTIRIPVASDIAHPLRGIVSKDLVDRLSTLRAHVVALAEEIYSADASAVQELQRALEQYLPVVLGLTMKESRLESSVQFRWKTLDDDEECCLASAWYEVLSVVHMMAMLALFEANLLLIPKNSQVGGERKVSEDAKKDVVDSLLRASGCLDYSVHRILVQIPAQVKKSFPSYLQEGMLEAISIQALAQCVEIQLGLASECEKATLSVKRRLACEQVSYFSQAHYCLSGCDTSDSYGKKLLLFLKWKCMEAKAVAYYYHGLVLDKGGEPANHISAVCCLSAADDLLSDSKRACLSFCLANPVTRVPPPWGVMKNMHKKIPDVAYKKFQVYGHLFEQNKNSTLQSIPDLPEFALSLRPEGYELPSTDSIWENDNGQPQIQSLKEHLNDGEDEDLNSRAVGRIYGKVAITYCQMLTYGIVYKKPPSPPSVAQTVLRFAAMAAQFAAAGVLTGLLALATFASCNTEGDILYKQRLAWKDPNSVLESWDPTLVNPCTWFHVTCNNNNSVIRVDLGNAGISGPLLPDLAEIQNLQYIELYGNYLNGSIPATLGNLTNLISLDLWDNLLTGPIPTTLGSISTLRYLRLYQNNLTGPIPSSFGNLTSLRELKLQENSLSGSIPASLGSIKALQFLKLNDNMLTGTVPLEVLSLVIVGNLTELNIAGNNLDGTVRSSGLRVSAVIQDVLKTA